MDIFQNKYTLLSLVNFPCIFEKNVYTSSDIERHSVIFHDLRRVTREWYTQF